MIPKLATSFQLLKNISHHRVVPGLHSKIVKRSPDRGFEKAGITGLRIAILDDASSTGVLK